MSKKEQIASLIHQVRDIRVMANRVTDELNTMINEEAEEEKAEEVTYRIGQRFILGSEREEYILARTGAIDRKGVECELICLIDGIRWAIPHKVKDFMKITVQEMDSLATTGWELEEGVIPEGPTVSDR